MNRIFLIDDDEMANYSNELIVGKLGIFNEVEVFSSGISALNRLKEMAANGKYAPQLVLLDLNMPLMNGFTFLDELRSLPEHFMDRASIVVLTSSLDDNDRKRAICSDLVLDLVQKPLNVEKITEIVNRMKQKNEG